VAHRASRIPDFWLSTDLDDSAYDVDPTCCAYEPESTDQVDLEEATVIGEWGCDLRNKNRFITLLSMTH
jgi:hypothetical protein